MEPDDLFRVNEPAMLPVFNTFRSGNLTESFIQSKFGNLMTALTIKKWSQIGGFIAAGLFLIIMIGCIIKMQSLKKKKSTFKVSDDKLVNRLMDSSENKENYV